MDLSSVSYISTSKRSVAAWLMLLFVACCSCTCCARVTDMPVSSLVVEGGPIGACPGDVGLWKPMEASSASSADDRRATNRQSPCIGGGRYTRAQCASSGAEKNRCPSLVYHKEVVPHSQWAESLADDLVTPTDADGIVDVERSRLFISDHNASALADYVHRHDVDVGDSRPSREILNATVPKVGYRSQSDARVVPVALVLFLSWSDRSRSLAPLYSALARSYPDVDFIAVDIVQLCKVDPVGCSSLFTPGPGKICAFANDVVVFDAATLRTLGVYRTSKGTTLRSLTTFFTDVTGLEPTSSVTLHATDHWMKSPSTDVSDEHSVIPVIKLVLSLVAVVACAACLVYLGYVAFGPTAGLLATRSG